jgi:hypothetical protein
MADGDVCAYKIRSVRQIRAFSQESAQGIFPIGRISAPRVLAGGCRTSLYSFEDRFI